MNTQESLLESGCWLVSIKTDKSKEERKTWEERKKIKQAGAEGWARDAERQQGNRCEEGGTHHGGPKRRKDQKKEKGGLGQSQREGIRIIVKRRKKIVQLKWRKSHEYIIFKYV